MRQTAVSSDPAGGTVRPGHVLAITLAAIIAAAATAFVVVLAATAN